MSYTYRVLITTTILALGARSATAQAPAAAPPGPQITVGGLSYFQFGYQLDQDSVGDHNNAFDLTRAYININGKFGGGVAARITPDIYRAADGTLNYRLKYAYVAYTPGTSPLTYKFGVTQTPWLDWEEALWDYRMQGTMPMERNGYVTSSDLGAAVDGSWNHDKVNVQAGVYNGEGYSKPSGDQRKDVMARVSFRLLETDDQSRVGGLRVTAYAGYGKPTSGGTRQRYVGLVSYRSKKALLAGEFASTKDTVTATPTPETTGRVMSAYGWYEFVPKVRAVARVDIWDPNTDTADNKQTRSILGVSYQVSPNFRLLADWDHLSFEGTPTNAQKATASQALLQLQFNF